MLTLDRVDIEHIPMTNLRALVKYVEHPGWPDLGRLPTSSPKKRNPVKARGDPNNDNALRRQMIQDGSLLPPDQIEEDEDAAVPALVRLTEWANAVIQYVVAMLLCLLCWYMYMFVLVVHVVLVGVTSQSYGQAGLSPSL